MDCIMIENHSINIDKLGELVGNKMAQRVFEFAKDRDRKIEDSDELLMMRGIGPATVTKIQEWIDTKEEEMPQIPEAVLKTVTMVMGLPIPRELATTEKLKEVNEAILSNPETVKSAQDFWRLVTRSQGLAGNEVKSRIMFLLDNLEWKPGGDHPRGWFFNAKFYLAEKEGCRAFHGRLLLALRAHKVRYKWEAGGHLTW